MAALTQDSKVNYRGLGPRQTNAFVIANAAQLFVGSLLQITAATGLVANYVQNLGATNPVVGVAVGGGIPGSNPVLDGYNLGSLPIPMIAPGNVSTAAAGNAKR